MRKMWQNVAEKGYFTTTKYHNMDLSKMPKNKGFIKKSTFLWVPPGILLWCRLWM